MIEVEEKYLDIYYTRNNILMARKKVALECIMKRGDDPRWYIRVKNAEYEALGLLGKYPNPELLGELIKDSENKCKSNCSYLGGFGVCVRNAIIWNNIDVLEQIMGSINRNDIVFKQGYYKIKRVNSDSYTNDEFSKMRAYISGTFIGPISLMARINFYGNFDDCDANDMKCIYNISVTSFVGSYDVDIESFKKYYIGRIERGLATSYNPRTFTGAFRTTEFLIWMVENEMVTSEYSSRVKRSLRYVVNDYHVNTLKRYLIVKRGDEIVKYDNFRSVEIVKHIYSVTKKKPLSADFVSACVCGSTDVAKWFLEINPRISPKFQNNKALRIACEENYSETVRYLLDLGLEDREIDFKRICKHGNLEIAKIMKSRTCILTEHHHINVWIASYDHEIRHLMGKRYVSKELYSNAGFYCIHGVFYEGSNSVNEDKYNRDTRHFVSTVRRKKAIQ